MFCDSCGEALQAGQGYCTRCGKQVIGPVTPGSGRVARHTHLLGILWIAYSAISGIGGVVLMIVARTIFGPLGLPSMPGGPPMFIRPLLSAIAIVLLCKAAVGIAAGLGLLQRQDWGRILAIVLGVISLINIPFGTALGIYTLWVLVSPGADQEYQALARSAG
ncbi:MAG: transmembrane 9 family protein [Acidobacteriia bacterium]|nr:transmembrane 9 family protein [Terriglobia bacterium]